MKKYLSIILICLISMCCFFGCKQKEVPTQTSGFEKPEDYATVLTVSINPIFKLYLNIDNEVLAIEPINDDAKGIEAKIKCEKKDVGAVVKKIIECTDENGFLKKDAIVDIKVTETIVSEDEQSEIIAIVEKETKENFKQIEVSVSIALEDKKQDTEEAEVVTKESDDSNLQSDSGKETITATDKTQTDKKPNDISSSTPKPSTVTHTHKYADATCKSPRTCSCGSTEGAALGHNYVEGVCSLCNEKDPNFRYPTLSSMRGSWIMKFVEGNYLYVQDYSFGEAVVCGEWKYLLKSAWPELEQGKYCSNERCIILNNQHYCSEGGGLVIDESTFSESNDTINVFDDYNHKMVLQRTSTNTMKVISIEEGFAYGSEAPVGTVLKFEADN